MLHVVVVCGLGYVIDTQRKPERCKERQRAKDNSTQPLDFPLNLESQRA